MSAERRERLRAALSAHVLEYGPGGRICTCGHSPNRPDPELLLTQQDVHREHLADVIAAALWERP